MNCHQLCTETLVALSEILQAPPPSVMMQWIPIGSGELKVSYTIARLHTWIDDLNEYDEKRDPTSEYWLTEGPLAMYRGAMCELCGSVLGKREYDRECQSENCGWNTRDDLLCDKCMPLVEDWFICLHCLIDEDVKPNDALIPEEVKLWLSHFAQDTLDWEEIPLERRRR